MNFIQRKIFLLITVTYYLIFRIRHTDINIEIYLKYLLYVVLYIQFMYQFERLLRIHFLEQQKMLIIFNQNNKIQRCKEIFKENHKEFLKMINNMQFSIQNYKSRVNKIIQVDNYFPQKSNLSNNYYQIIPKIKKVAIQLTKHFRIIYTPFRQQIHLYGFYYQQIFALSIFQSFDIQPIIILLVVEKHKIKKQKLRKKNYSKQLIFIQQIWIYNFADKQTDGKQINQIIKLINNNFIRSYTNFNVISQNKINLIQFLFIQDVISFYDGYFKQILKFYLIIQNSQQFKNYQYYIRFQYKKLLLFNLIHNPSDKQQTITIILDEMQTEFSQTPIISIKLLFEAPNLTKIQLQELAILCLQFLEELNHNSIVLLDFDLAVTFDNGNKIRAFCKNCSFKTKTKLLKNFFYSKRSEKAFY
ncbi:unnamed protein product [Paramecium sonneborni]|uniref:Transmembrane protein n=1 Tax=Paramecium sonneborni TaxID=65129 RepID=A0A8S1QI97_9CILI|nr:unnamed protein product [Paramecium sonneborni]